MENAQELDFGGSYQAQGVDEAERYELSDFDRRRLEHWETPAWAAQRLVENFADDLTERDNVLDLGTGRGVFLAALPPNVPAFGIEIDKGLCDFTRDQTGRDVYCGDFLTMHLDSFPKPTRVIGNPPWSETFLTPALDICHSILPEGGKVQIVIPSHRLSYAGPVMALSKKWSIHQTHLPQSLFPRLRWPFVFATFVKERVRKLYGFFLFDECLAAGQAPKNVKLILTKGARRKGVWRAVVEEAIHALGGRANHDQIYAYIEGRRPRPIPTWRATIRRELQSDCFLRWNDHTFSQAAA